MNERESFGEALGRLPGDLANLFRAELQLLRIQLTDQIKDTSVALAWLAGGLVAGGVAVLVLTAFLIEVLALAMPWWAATLIVGVIYSAGASALVLAGKRRFQETMPIRIDETTESVKEDVAWIRNGTTSTSR